MPYQNPTLFGMVYASRLHREIDKSLGFDEQLRRKTLPALDLQDRDHARALLEWLNKWGCRITKDSFPKISRKLGRWFGEWQPRLPHTGRGLVSLEDRDLAALIEAYDKLLAIDDFGPTSASKALFAVCPDAAIPWDAAIQANFASPGRAPESYRLMLVRSKHEGELLIADAARCGVAEPQDIPREVGRPDHTLVQLLDEYHWITITRGHEIPSREVVQQWAKWVGP